MNSLNSVNVNAKKISTCIMAFVVFILCASLASAYVNPAAKFCIDEGYNYVIEADADGNEIGFCVLDNGDKEDAWHFYNANYEPDKHPSGEITLFRESKETITKSLEHNEDFTAPELEADELRSAAASIINVPGSAKHSLPSILNCFFIIISF